MDARLAVLASGTGTNLQTLLDDHVVGPWVALAVSDRPDACALAGYMRSSTGSTHRRSGRWSKDA